MHDSSDAIPNLSAISEAAQSDTGKKLAELLQKNNANTVQEALACAAAGNLSSAKALLAPLLSSPEAQQLLRELGEK